jgi:hypothetical protein
MTITTPRIKLTSIIYTLIILTIGGNGGAYLTNHYAKTTQGVQGKANILALSEYIDSQH